MGCLGTCYGSLGAIDLNLKSGRIDPVKNIAAIDMRALLEDLLDNDAGDTRANFGKPCRRDAAGQFVDDRQGFSGNRHDADRAGRRRLLGLPLLLLLAPCQKCETRQKCESAQRRLLHRKAPTEGGENLHTN
ncbi:hypothetical protein D3C87_1728060 [compost metagenome]